MKLPSFFKKEEVSDVKDESKFKCEKCGEEKDESHRMMVAGEDGQQKKTETCRFC